jgi:hypothetical protein
MPMRSVDMIVFVLLLYKPEAQYIVNRRSNYAGCCIIWPRSLQAASPYCIYQDQIIKQIVH